MKNSVHFDQLEDDKENVVAMKKGRAVSSIVELQNKSGMEVQRIRDSFTRRIMEEINDLDDPLELFLEYIAFISNEKATLDLTSKQNGLLDAMEQCLMFCQDMERYKNDVRYVDVWLSYIDTFYSNCELEKRDLFVHMFRNQIGSKLSTFYEKFSFLLVKMGRLNEAFKIIQIGIDKNVQQAKKLQFKLEELKDIMTIQKINIRNSNLISFDEYFDDCESPTILDRNKKSIIKKYKERLDKSEDGCSQNKITTNPTRNLIYKDDTDDYKNDRGRTFAIYNDSQKPNNTFQTKNELRKENRIESKLIEDDTNIGALQQLKSHGRKIPDKKQSIFNDSNGMNGPVYKIIQTDAGKLEKIDCNLELIYNGPMKKEVSIEEIMAIARNLYQLRYSNKRLNDNDEGIRDTPNSKRIKF